jgi:uncharacterized protein (DUF58 family)
VLQLRDPVGGTRGALLHLAPLKPGESARAAYRLPTTRRGIIAVGPLGLEVGDPFGLAVQAAEAAPVLELTVYPRVDPVGAPKHGGDRDPHGAASNLNVLGQQGDDFYALREYVVGDDLRRVHWPSTARRGQLMVKELEDAPRDEIALLLDADASSVLGESFDVQVRAAGSILDAYVRRGRRAVLVVNSEQREVQHVHSPASDWRRALELLAAVEPTGTTPASRLLAEEDGPVARALDLAIVTARLEPALVDRLVQRALSRRNVSLTYVDPASFKGAVGRPEPALLRLQAAGVPVAVIRAGDDLAARLEGQAAAEALHG